MIIDFNKNATSGSGSGSGSSSSGGFNLPSNCTFNQDGIEFLFKTQQIDLGGDELDTIEDKLVVDKENGFILQEWDNDKEDWGKIVEVSPYGLITQSDDEIATLSAIDGLYFGNAEKTYQINQDGLVYDNYEDEDNSVQVLLSWDKMATIPTFWHGTQAEYDALDEKDDNTLYIITE